MKAAWLSRLVGVAMLAMVLYAALHVSETGGFVELVERAQPAWLAIAVLLQACTYLAQAQVWRGVTAAAATPLPLGAAYRLSLVKLLVDQALPSSGLSGSVVVAGALRQRGVPGDVATSGLVVSAAAYLAAYAVALAAGLMLLPPSLPAGRWVAAAGGLFAAAALLGAGLAIRLTGTTRLAGTPLGVHAAWLQRPLELLRGANTAIVRDPRVLAMATAMQLAIVLLDGLTVWALLKAVGATAPIAAVFASFMVSTVLRTISIVPGGLGAFEAAAILTLHGAGVGVPAALSATLLFRFLSFWLPMLPAALLARGIVRQRAGGADAPEVGAFWSQDPRALAAALGSTLQGLDTQAAERQLQRHGPNSVEDQPRVAALRLLARQFESPLVLILVFGAAVSAFLRDWADALIILAIVGGSALLGFTQEYRAGTAVAALRRRLALEVRVLRDGRESTIAAAAIVPGDVVLLSAGNLVPADGLVLEARDFLVSEASLTGESFPVEKQPGVVAGDTALARRSNCVFLGTSVRSGSARVLVVRTGRATSFGAIAATIAARPPESDFARGIRHFGHLLMRTMVLIVLLVVAANQWLQRPALESLLFAVALAVGLTPELLPAIVSVTLSRGAREMAARGVIVRRLEAIENLGSVQVLCTDKTGTLTEGVITLQGAVDLQGAASDAVGRLGFLNASLETGIRNPVDAAIVAAGPAHGWDAAGVRKVDEIPYDFTRKRLTIVVEEKPGGPHRIITKGAFDNVLAACRLSPELRDACVRYYQQASAEGLRVLALATRETAPQARYTREDETGMQLAGFLLFLDPPKPGVATTLRQLARLGIRTKVISGDNRHIVAHVARAIGIDARAMLTGEQLARLNDEALWSLAPRTDLFVEVDPQQKERIVRALQRTGHAVGYLGDGINDAPALYAADVGISVEGAVDVARESADIVLLERDLAVLRRGVEDGRAIFANTLKYISITISANFGNMVSMAIATPLLPFLPMAAKQILLNNFISDLPSMAISTDRVDARQLRRAQRWDLGEVRRFMVIFGLLSTVFDLLTFGILLKVFDADQPTFQTAWFIVSLLTELAVVLVLRTRGPAWRSAPSALLLATTAAAALAAVSLPFTGAAAALLGFVPLPAGLVATAAGIVAAYVLTTEAAKLAFYARRRTRRPGAAGPRHPRPPH